MWPAVNGVASANCEKTMFCLSSDGSQQEGDDAEAVPKTSTSLTDDNNDVAIIDSPRWWLQVWRPDTDEICTLRQ
ncbi:hypothetical protein M378DRAFT_169135 [Amanita muscaria Koide BX008]|uniref:Uncharacterized protein n=1 Tax=Amanita muscaria (strain Koide BX008) TaxID=946122 RepID=A0A0C2WTE9_AMAMK|nr:hypothetical protein M378DRAFT_169135 [Amanita muscaria Koide BX008]